MTLECKYLSWPSCPLQDCDCRRVQFLHIATANPLNDPRVAALVALINRAQDIIDPCYPAKHETWQNDTRAALSALETEQ